MFHHLDPNKLINNNRSATLRSLHQKKIKNKKESQMPVQGQLLLITSCPMMTPYDSCKSISEIKMQPMLVV